MRARFESRVALCLALTVLLLGAAVGCSQESRQNNRGIIPADGQALTAAEVDLIITQAVSEANVRGVATATSVVTREGEVLGQFIMNGTDQNGDGIVDNIDQNRNGNASISKAGTAAFFQSSQNSFSTRSAFFIVQGNYPPGVRNTPGGPLFGVQDSSQTSSDAKSFYLSNNAADPQATANQVGAGISGELGGFPIYKNNAPVGGLGVDTADVLVTLGGAPTVVSGVQRDIDEIICNTALNALNFNTPGAITADKAFVDGFALPYASTAVGPGQPLLAADTTGLQGMGVGVVTIPIRADPLNGEVTVNGVFGVRANNGQQRRIARRVAPLTPTFVGANVLTTPAADAAVPMSIFDDTVYQFQNVPLVPLQTAIISNVPVEIRFDTIDSVAPPPAMGGLTAADVNAMFNAGVPIAFAASAGIRLPRGSSVRVHIIACDLRGNILGMVRIGDGTLFSFDVAVQKARTSAFYSANNFAFTCRSLGFLGQPFFPPGIQGTLPGPMVRQRDLINRGKIPAEQIPSLTLINPPPRPPSDGTFDDNILMGGVQAFNDFTVGNTPPAGNVAAARAITQAFGGLLGGFNVLQDVQNAAGTGIDFVSPGLQSGIQSFPGGVPLYKNGMLVGGCGVSGDGVDEDDLVAASCGNLFPPPRGTRVDEVNETVMSQVLTGKVSLLATAAQAHPNPVISTVYGPIFQTEAAFVSNRFAQGLQGVRVPYVKLPRQPFGR